MTIYQPTEAEKKTLTTIRGARNLSAYFLTGTLDEQELKWVAEDWPKSRRHQIQTWGFQLHPSQQPPEADWSTWLFLGGRGAGKTRAGAEWIKSVMHKGVRCALIAPTIHDVREVMIEGPSGLIATANDHNRPYYEVSRKRLIWPKGGVAYAFSAEDPDSLRGPQFHYAWGDEFCAWRHAAHGLAMLRLGLRLGGGPRQRPRLCLTTTPRPIKALRDLMAEDGVAVTRAATRDNAQNLSADFVDGLNRLYGGTRLAAQELDGLVVDDDLRALWRADELARCLGAAPPRFDEIVVAVDPPASDSGNACGIVLAGRLDGRGYVLADATVSGRSPTGWATIVQDMVQQYSAHRVVAEGNQGGDMVRNVLASVGCQAVDMVYARDSKRVRAEPVAALYEQGRVTHCGRFAALEEELMGLGEGGQKSGTSPDRADALVWALTELLVKGAEPRMRRL